MMPCVKAEVQVVHSSGISTLAISFYCSCFAHPGTRLLASKSASIFMIDFDYEATDGDRPRLARVSPSPTVVILAPHVQATVLGARPNDRLMQQKQLCLP
jgi:hypothetical protein